MNVQYVMFKEFCEICGICPTTGRKAIAKKKVSFQKCQDGKLHYYKIPLSEVLQYKKDREERGILTDAEVEVRINYYRRKMTDYPDLINAGDIREITGYGKEIIRRWINSEKILGIVVRGKFCVAKEDLLDFMISPYYETIIRKSEEHKKDCKSIEKIPV